jgi:hypothetical protein
MTNVVTGSQFRYLLISALSACSYRLHLERAKIIIALLFDFRNVINDVHQLVRPRFSPKRGLGPCSVSSSQR